MLNIRECFPFFSLPILLSYTHAHNAYSVTDARHSSQWLSYGSFTVMVNWQHRSFMHRITNLGLFTPPFVIMNVSYALKEIMALAPDKVSPIYMWLFRNMKSDLTASYRVHWKHITEPPRYQTDIFANAAVTIADFALLGQDPTQDPSALVPERKAPSGQWGRDRRF